MPSFTALITMAVGLLALSAPVLASEMADSPLAARDVSFTDSVFARHQVEKRAGSNFGAKCRGNYMCRSNIANSRPSCSANGICGYKCLGNTVARGDRCVPKYAPHTCGRSSHCPSHVSHGDAYCYKGKCTTRCDSGYHYNNGACTKNAPTCANKTCYNVDQGYSECHDGKCSYKCATYLGYTLFTNSAKTAYRCVDLAADPDNCGTLGNVCPTGYNGKGVPECNNGTCDLNCNGYASTMTLNGAPYCTDH